MPCPSCPCVFWCATATVKHQATHAQSNLVHQHVLNSRKNAHTHTRARTHTHTADSQASSLSKYLVYSDLAPRPKSAIMRHGERVVLATCYGGYRGKAGGVEAFVSVSRLRTVCHYSNSTQVHAVRGLFLQSLWGKAYLKLAPRASGPRKVGGQPTLVFGTLIAFMCFCTVLSFVICKCVKIAPSHHTVSDAGTSTSRPDAYVSQDAAYFAKSCQCLRRDQRITA